MYRELRTSSTITDAWAELVHRPVFPHKAHHSLLAVRNLRRSLPVKPSTRLSKMWQETDCVKDTWLCWWS